MRLLCVTAFLPADFRREVHGLFKRLRLFLVAAARAAREVHLLAFVAPSRDASPAEAARLEEELAARWGVRVRLSLCRDNRPGRRPTRWESYGAPALSARASPLALSGGDEQLRAFEAALAEEPDALFVHRLAATFPALRTRRPLPPMIFDLDDVEHVVLARAVRQPPYWLGKPLTLFQLPALMATERRACAVARRTLVCSEEDRRRLGAWGMRGVDVLENAIAIPTPAPQPAAPTLLLLGIYSYTPNAVGAGHLLARIWPRIRAAVPDARLVIAGAFPELIPGYDRAGPGVEFRGFVDDLDALYAEARVAVVPLLSGGGTRIKIIEAAAYARAIVSTRVGAEGLAFVPEHEILLRDAPWAFADACIGLLRDEAGCRRLGEAARARAVARYDAARAVDRIADLLRDVAAGR